jgi:hypothetical protein
MSITHEETALSPEERRFREYITRGDDFCKIELFRYAVGWYRRAVELKPDNEEARIKLQGCRGRIKSETRTILIIAGVAALIVIAAVIIW